jgi:hypothetical protein
MSTERVISVITAVLGTKADYLAEAYGSLAAQELPEGWSWEWLVQQDGPDGALSLPTGDPRIRSGISNRWGGQAIARNLALSRAHGDLIKVLDADDMLTPGALTRDIEIFTTRPDITWSLARSLNYLLDGTTTRFPSNPDPGPIAPDVLLPYWEHHGEPPVHPASLCVRRQAVLALGGWMAVPGAEDTGLLLALDATSTGYFIGEPGLLHRRWPGQNTANRPDDDERRAVLNLIGARARALRTLQRVIPAPRA